MRDREFIKVEKKLYNYTTSKSIIENITLDLQMIEKQYQSGMIQQSSSLEDIRVSKTNSQYPLEEWLLYKDEQYDRLLTKKLKLVNEVKKIDNGLLILTDVEKKIIELRYFQLRKWSNISIMTNYSISHCKVIRIVAINKLKKVLF